MISDSGNYRGLSLLRNADFFEKWISSGCATTHSLSEQNISNELLTRGFRH